MRAMPIFLGASFAAVSILIAITVTKSSKIDVGDSGTVRIVPAKSFYNTRLTARLAYFSADGSGSLPSNAVNTAYASDRPTTNSEVVNQLSESIANEDKDLAWGSAVHRDSNALLSGIPFLKDQRSLTCGTIRCEIAIRVPADISLSNMTHVLEKLSTLPSGSYQYPFIVEGVFPVDENGSPDKAIRVIYMRHSN